MENPDASKGRCTFAHDILTEPFRLKLLYSFNLLQAKPCSFTLFFGNVKPLYFLSCCAALAVSFCSSSIDFCEWSWSPRSALTALSLSLARPSCHWPLPCCCSFSCCCFSFSASSGRASLSAREMTFVSLVDCLSGEPHCVRLLLRTYEEHSLCRQRATRLRRKSLMRRKSG
jgi:hypothetical protein